MVTPRRAALRLLATLCSAAALGALAACADDAPPTAAAPAGSSALSVVPTAWDTVDLHCLDDHFGCEAYDINNKGMVVGLSRDAANTRAVAWNAAVGAGSIRDLGGPAGSISAEAFAVNEAGDAVGDYVDAYERHLAVLWLNDGTVVNLGGGTRAMATGINDSRRVVGWFATKAGPEHAFSWTATTGMTDLGAAGCTRSYTWSWAYGVSDSGLVAGAVGTGTGPSADSVWAATYLPSARCWRLVPGAGAGARALAVALDGSVTGGTGSSGFVYTSLALRGWGSFALTVPAGGSTRAYADGAAINVHDDAAGTAYDPDPSAPHPSRAVYWPAKKYAPIDLGGLGGYGASAAGINDNSWVVGWSNTATYPYSAHAVLWRIH